MVGFFTALNVYCTCILFLLSLLLAGIEPYELEDFLAEILSNEFDTVANDGSLEQVCCFFV